MRASHALVAVPLLLLALGACTGEDTSAEERAPSSVATTTTTTDAAATTTTALPATSTAATTGSISPTTIPPPPVTPVPGWKALPGVFDGVTLTDGAERSGRYVIAGCRTDAAVATPVDTPLPLWWSEDLTTWERGEGAAGLGCVAQVVATPFGFFAAGNGHQLWSDDGAAWQALELHEPLGLEFPGQLGSVQAMFVAPDDDRVTLLYTRAAEAESTVASLVTTRDGESWSLGPADSAALFDSSVVAGVTPGGDGLVAVGSSPGGEFVPTAVVYTSLDGLTWRRLTPRTAPFNDAVMTAVASVDDGYVAVGGDFFQTGLMTAWTSADGLGWARSSHPDETTDPAVAFMTAESLTVDGTQVWASGIDSDARRGDVPALPALWTSTDAGSTWSRIEIPDEDGVIPFVIYADLGTAIGVWPPPKSSVGGPARLFVRDTP